MNIRLIKPQAILFLLLAVVMMATRFNHFGSTKYLADASWAVFFLAGFYLTNRLALPLLLIEAGLLDYLAINVGGVSDWCVTTGYWFLIPAYAALWLGGRWYAARHRIDWTSLATLVSTLLIATIAAFIISNAGFYLFSNYFPEMGWIEFSTRVAKYLPPYAGWAFIYVGMAALLHVAVTTLWPSTAVRHEHR